MELKGFQSERNTECHEGVQCHDSWRCVVDAHLRHGHVRSRILVFLLVGLDDIAARLCFDDDVSTTTKERKINLYGRICLRGTR